MVTELKMKSLLGLIAILAFGSVALVGCGEAAGEDLSKVESQPPADLEAGKNAKTVEEWAKSNPNNGAPGHGDSADK